MIVFYFVILIFSLFFTITFSSIVLEFENCEIKDIKNLKEIYLLIENKKYSLIFKYIKLNIRIRIKIFNIFKITIFKIDEKRANKIIKKIIDKKNKRRNQYLDNHTMKENKNKKKINKIKARLANNIYIEEVRLKVGISLASAEKTAILTSILNTFTSIIFLYAYEKCNSFAKVTEKNLKYNFKPIYSNTVEFYLRTKLKLNAPIYMIYFK